MGIIKRQFNVISRTKMEKMMYFSILILVI
nr:MAG TPA: hypothetical protein [Caudoviricetes sp.]